MRGVARLLHLVQPPRTDRERERVKEGGREKREPLLPPGGLYFTISEASRNPGLGEAGFSL